MAPTLTKQTARWIGGGIAVVEGLAALSRHARRTEVYAQAQQRAKETGRTLVVVGDPDAGAHTKLARAYGCGDVCVDLNDCPACPTSEAVDLTTQQSKVPSDSAVVYVSCVLEYVNDFNAAWAEIFRMAGSPSNVYMATVQPWTLTAVLYPGAQYTVTEQGQGTRISDFRKVATVAGLGWFCLKML